MSIFVRLWRSGCEGAAIDVNDFEFVYSPNVDPENEQETTEISIKFDKELDGMTLTGWALYSDQEQYFLADGTSIWFILVSTVQIQQMRL